MEALDFVPLLVAIALVKKLLDVVRYALADDWRNVATQVIAWVAGVAVIMLFAASDWAAGFQVGSLALANMNLASQVLAGFALASTASLAVDAIKAIDNSQSAAVPDKP